MRRKDVPLIGAHTSTAGGLHHAIDEGRMIGATTIQLFTSNQRQWQGRTITAEELLLWERALGESDLQQLMSHDSYLINLGSPKEDVLRKSRQAFGEEIFRCQQLKLSFLNFHPGAALQESVESCLNRIVESLMEMTPRLAGGSLRLLLETTAGQGSVVGSCFEELSYIIERVKNHLPIGVCVDTCHIFAAGYDLRTEKDLEEMLNQFDAKIGLEWLFAFHLNDSLKGLGERIDRHQPLGKGAIGLSLFQRLMHHPKTKGIPKYLETPGGPSLWKEEIALLKTHLDEKE